MALLASVASLEINRSIDSACVFGLDGTKSLLCVMRSSCRLDFVGADCRLDTTFDCATEEVENLTSFPCFGFVDIFTISLVWDGRVIRHGLIKLPLSCVERPVCTCSAKVFVTDCNWFLWWGLVDTGRWWQRCLVSFADSEEGDGELSVGRYTLE